MHATGTSMIVGSSDRYPVRTAHDSHQETWWG
jgi:hypothetical protein